MKDKNAIFSNPEGVFDELNALINKFDNPEIELNELRDGLLTLTMIVRGIWKHVDFFMDDYIETVKVLKKLKGDK
jgi:hypothetical protein